MALGLENLAFSGSFGVEKLAFIGKVIGLIILVGALILVVMYFMQYNVKCTIFERKGNNIIKIKDARARKIKDGGVEKYKLMKFLGKGEVFPPPDKTETTYVKGKNDYLMLLKQAGTLGFKPVILNDKVEAELVVIPQDVAFWHLQEQKNTLAKYKAGSWWDKHGATVLLLTGLIIIFVMFIISIQQQGKVAEAFVHASNVLKDIGSQTLTPK